MANSLCPLRHAADAVLNLQNRRPAGIVFLKKNGALGKALLMELMAELPAAAYGEKAARWGAAGPAFAGADALRRVGPRRLGYAGRFKRGETYEI